MLEQLVQDYLKETLGVSARIRQWNGGPRLPAFLRGRYRFVVTEISGREFLLAIDESEAPESPSVVRKHIEQVEAKRKGAVVYVREQVSAYHRKRLIQQGVPFIVPGNQMFLPDLGIDFREYFRSAKLRRGRFRPATQAVLIDALLGSEVLEFTASRFASSLGYSAITLSRAFSELEDAGLIRTEMLGRERVARLNGERHAVWEKAQGWLRDPVQSRHFVESFENADGALLAGASALAVYSQLGAPSVPVFAFERKVWRRMKEALRLAIVQWPTPKAVMVEIWKYPPRSFEIAYAVDPLSLYLALKETKDDRELQAIEDMLGGIRW